MGELHLKAAETFHFQFVNPTTLMVCLAFFDAVVCVPDFIKFKSRTLGRVGRIAAEGPKTDKDIAERLAKLEALFRESLLGVAPHVDLGSPVLDQASGFQEVSKSDKVASKRTSCSGMA